MKYIMHSAENNFLNENTFIFSLSKVYTINVNLHLNKKQTINYY